MKIRTILWIVLLAVSFCSKVIAASSIAGDWTTIDDVTGKKRAIVRLVLENGIVSGTVLYIYPHPGDTGICSQCPDEFKDKPMKGLKIIWGLKETADGVWDGGRILDAKNGRIYRLKMSVIDGKLHLRGYIGISLLGRTQVWLPT